MKFVPYTTQTIFLSLRFACEQLIRTENYFNVSCNLNLNELKMG